MSRDPTKPKRRRTTVGSIVVPELPWRRVPAERAIELLREPDPYFDHDPQLSRFMLTVCPTCGHASGELDYCDQVDCDCVDPFHCT